MQFLKFGLDSGADPDMINRCTYWGEWPICTILLSVICAPVCDVSSECCLGALVVVTIDWGVVDKMNV